MSQRPAPRLYRTDESRATVRAAFLRGDLPVAVYGLGKMGLPLAAVYASLTGNVVGVDVDESVVAAVNDGVSPVEREPGLADLVAETAADGSLRAVSDPAAAAAAAAVHVIIVPTPLTDDREPDLSILEAVLEDVAAGLDPGDLVVVECTVPPGTCRDVVEPRLAADSGLEPDEFGVAYCPERTSSGTAIRDITESYPKVVGGTDAPASAAAELVYEQVTDAGVILLPDAATAEAVKLFEGVYRDVNIALANELARLGDDLGVDVRDAIDAANTQPYCDIHAPGPGVGGHCIPYYPYFVTSRVEEATPMLLTAREVNDSMPAFTVETLRRRAADHGVDLDDAAVAVLGVTYRPGVDEASASPARGVVAGLTDAGADVYVVDPILEDPGLFGGTPCSLSAVTALDLDAAVVVTPHEEFDAIDWDALDPMVVLDGRDSLDLEHTHHHVYALGRQP